MPITRSIIRRLTAAGGALVLAGGLALVATGPAEARTVIPHHGAYSGTDHGHRKVSFTFGSHNQITHFTVGHQVIGGAHVSRGMWHETCHGGVCFKGQWTSDTHVSGAWRYGGSDHWVHWQASFEPPVHPYTGTYRGRDHRDLQVHFSYSHHQVVQFTLDHNVIGSASVTNRRFEACHHHICFKGHWQTEHYVVGSWRHANGHEWTGWEAHAYSA